MKAISNTKKKIQKGKSKLNPSFALWIMAFLVCANFGIAQQRTYNAKITTKKVSSNVAVSSKKVPLFEATNKDIAKKTGEVSKSRVPKTLPTSTLTTVIPATVKSSGSKLSLTLTPRKVYTSKGYIINDGGYSNPVDDEIMLQPKAAESVDIYFRAKYGKSYLVTLEMRGGGTDFYIGAAKCNNPKLIVQLNGVQQTFDLSEGMNKLEFVVQSKVSGMIEIPIANASCSRKDLKPRLRFKKVGIKEL